MKFDFDIPKKSMEEILDCTQTPDEELEWVPLQHHPVFTTTTTNTSGATSPTHRNLIASDRASCLYFWDLEKHFLHRLCIRIGDPDPSSVFAASLSKILQPDVEVNFEVNNISINRNGSAILLSGSDGLCVMYLCERTLEKDDAIICRTVSVGSRFYFDDKNPIRTLQSSWHPYSDTHLGILSSDSIFRLFDLSSDLEKPEQEYCLQPIEPGRCGNAASIFSVGFSFGREHLWDKFTVFVLFSDGSIYILCPVVPFGSLYNWETIGEMYNVAHTSGLKSSNRRAVSNYSLTIAWLEGTFPELAHQITEGGNLSVLRAHPYAPFDASLFMQGPLRKVRHCEEDENSEAQGAECEGLAVGFLNNSINKDSVLVTAWSSGQLQIDALADEIQPVWNIGSQPHLHVDSHGHILGLGMICESNPAELAVVKLSQAPGHSVWLDHPPSLLRLAIVDFALPRNTDSDCLLSIFADPLIPERIYCLHACGLDLIVLQSLPFTSQTSGKEETLRTPSVYSVLSTQQGNPCSPSPLCGFVALADSFGYSWVVGVTSSRECVVLEMKDETMLMPIHVDGEEKLITLEEFAEMDTPDIISKEVLNGPKVVIVPQVSPNLGIVMADSIEGQSTLNQYIELLLENYIEYANKALFELKHHGAYLKSTIDEQHAHLREVEKRLLNVEENKLSLEDRKNRAVHVHELLEERLQTLRNFPGIHKKPPSRAEREFKSALDRFTGLDLDALRSSMDGLNARLRKYSQSPQVGAAVEGVSANVVNEEEVMSSRTTDENGTAKESVKVMQGGMDMPSGVDFRHDEALDKDQATLSSTGVEVEVEGVGGDTFGTIATDRSVDMAIVEPNVVVANEEIASVSSWYSTPLVVTEGVAASSHLKTPDSTIHLSMHALNFTPPQPTFIPILPNTPTVELLARISLGEHTPTSRPVVIPPDSNASHRTSKDDSVQAVALQSILPFLHHLTTIGDQHGSLAPLCTAANRFIRLVEMGIFDDRSTLDLKMQSTSGAQPNPQVCTEDPRGVVNEYPWFFTAFPQRIDCQGSSTQSLPGMSQAVINMKLRRFIKVHLDIFHLYRLSLDDVTFHLWEVEQLAESGLDFSIAKPLLEFAFEVITAQEARQTRVTIIESLAEEKEAITKFLEFENKKEEIRKKHMDAIVLEWECEQTITEVGNKMKAVLEQIELLQRQYNDHEEVLREVTSRKERHQTKRVDLEDELTRLEDPTMSRDEQVGHFKRRWQEVSEHIQKLQQEPFPVGGWLDNLPQWGYPI